MKTNKEYIEEYRSERQKKRKEALKKAKKYIYFFSFWVVLVLGIYIAGRIRTKEIEENKAFTTGQITNYNLYRGTCNLKYTYTVNGKMYKDIGTGQTIAPCNYVYFEGKYFPVIYSKRNPEKAGILITSYAFEAWGLKFPDSLQWVPNYLGY